MRNILPIGIELLLARQREFTLTSQSRWIAHLTTFWPVHHCRRCGRNSGLSAWSSLTTLGTNSNKTRCFVGVRESGSFSLSNLIPQQCQHLAGQLLIDSRLLVALKMSQTQTWKRANLKTNCEKFLRAVSKCNTSGNAALIPESQSFHNALQRNLTAINEECPHPP